MITRSWHKEICPIEVSYSYFYSLFFHLIRKRKVRFPKIIRMEGERFYARVDVAADRAEDHILIMSCCRERLADHGNIQITIFRGLISCD